MLTLGLAEPTGLVSLPLLFWLKDGLGLTPQSVAVFEAVALAPLYFGFLFGFLRDRWRPLGRNDRDRKSTRLNSSHIQKSRMPSSA